MIYQILFFIAAICVIIIVVVLLVMLANQVRADNDSTLGKFFPDYWTKYWNDIQRYLDSQKALGEELKCLKWNDGTMAVIQRYCNGEYETISWFLKHGYKIAAISVRTGNGEYPMVYMTR